jgi:hypothetical protein
MGRGRGRGREVVVKGGFVDFDLTVRGGGGGRVVSSRDFGIRRGAREKWTEKNTNGCIEKQRSSMEGTKRISKPRKVEKNV